MRLVLRLLWKALTRVLTFLMASADAASRPATVGSTPMPSLKKSDASEPFLRWRRLSPSR